jgi:4-amino-4-deoxy-L-arabinose transferase-like glycosyltransferase
LVLWLPALLLVTLAFLAKREPAVVFFYLGVGSYLLLQGRWRELLSRGHILAGLLAALLVVAWLATLAYRTGWEALWRSLVQEVLQRGDRGDWGRYLGHVLTYPFQVLGATLPFSLLLLPLAGGSLRRALQARHGNAAVFAATAVLANLPLYWLKGDLAVRYFMPMFPFLALLAAMSFETLTAQPNAAGRWQRSLAWLARVLYWLLPLLVLLFAATTLLPLVRPALDRPWPWPLILGLAGVAGLAVWRLYGWGRARPLAWLLPAMLLGTLLVRGLYFTVYLPVKAQSLAQQQNARAIAAELVRRVPPGRPLYVSPRIPSAVWFYAPRGLLVPAGDGGLLQEGDFLLRHDAVAALSGLAAERQLAPLARFRYENDDLSLEVVRDRKSVV